MCGGARILVSSLAAKAEAGLAHSSETPTDPSTEWLGTGPGRGKAAVKAVLKLAPRLREQGSGPGFRLSQPQGT